MSKKRDRSPQKGDGGKKKRGPTVESSSSTLSSIPANKKRRLRLERQSMKPEFEAAQKAKVLWIKLREKKYKGKPPEKEREKLATELLEIIQGKVLSICFKHASSRVVQCAISNAPTQKDRLSIIDELKGHIVDISKSKYGYFLVVKLIKQCRSKEEVTALVKELRGNMCRLSQHAVGGAVVQAALDNFPSSTSRLLRAELYGKQFAVFEDEVVPHRLSAAVADIPSDERAIVLSNVKSRILKMHSKGLLTLPFAQELLWEYMEVKGGEGASELAPQLTDAFCSLLSTRPGARSAAMMVGASGSRDRKRFIKSVKGVVTTSLCHRDAYLAVLRLILDTDDTVAVQKLLLSELLEPDDDVADDGGALGRKGENAGREGGAEGWVPSGITHPSIQPNCIGQEVGEDEGCNVDEGVEDDDKPDPAVRLLRVCMHPNGCKLVLCLLAQTPKALDPLELETILSPVLVPGGTGDDKGALVSASKKPSETKRKELVAFFQPHLEELCVKYPLQLMTSKWAGEKVVVEVLKAVQGEGVAEAVANAVAELGTVAAEHPTAHMCIKQILIWESHNESSQKKRAPFAHALLSRIRGSLLEWASSNRGAFVIAALRKVPSIAKEVDAELRKGAAQLIKMAKESKGAAALVEDANLSRYAQKKKSAAKKKLKNI